ncbi:hypothetical protein [Enterococcus rivorum]|uniref:Transcriptional regulator TetR C-terminal Firmicutes type domain-containing protein n=1 Tax=Enterococcus rivorum TaxID=762845 RepID=A0A1E5KZP9_9ENTE|nr:hypothetical protein [Enterococcus rivorum]MBP2099238.1 hypothetical protein [Enterococcus rivorum]OEH83382.1 hypothetical protein BCR26_09990 [Enterococcus rivorum]
MEAVIAQLKQEFSEKIDKVNLEDIDTVEAFLFIHLEILSQHEALYRNFISQRRLLGEQVNVCYLGIQSIFSHHFGLLLKEDIKVPLSMLFNTWLGLIHYYLNNDDLFGKEDIISKNRNQWIENYLKMIK